jgi:hypothetical protein
MIKFIKKVIEALKEKESLPQQQPQPKPKKPKVVKNSRINPKKPITEKMRTARAIKYRILQLNNRLKLGYDQDLIIEEIKILEWVLNKK